MSSTIKMEDISPRLSVSPPSAYSPTSVPSTPASLSQPSTTKPTRKRKSWGQVLPEPKTSLPPRKRAKTDDEKEQRRIERVKRNRHAAHLSREKKRQEFDEVQRERDELAVRVEELEVQLRQLQKIVSASFGTSNIAPDTKLDFQFNDVPTPPPSITIIPQETFPTPHSTECEDDFDLSLEPASLSSELTPSPSELPVPIPTQHSAAMLCDLQCRIGTLTPSARQRQRRFQATILYLISMNLHLFLTSLSSIVSWTSATMVQRFLISASTTNNSLLASMGFPVLASLSSTPALAQRFATSLALLRGSSIGASVGQQLEMLGRGKVMKRMEVPPDIDEVLSNVNRTYLTMAARRHTQKGFYREPGNDY